MPTVKQELDLAYESLDQCQSKLEQSEKTLNDLRWSIRRAIDELRRWQYSDNISDVQHSIDMAVRTLESA